MSVDFTLYQKGHLSIENVDQINEIDMTTTDVVFGVQTSSDGRVWVCINGIAWLRFKPKRDQPADKVRSLIG